MSWTILKISDTVLEFQGQVTLQTYKIFVLTLEIEPFHILPSNLNHSLIILKSQMGLKTVTLTLTFKVKLALKFKNFFVKFCQR